MSLEREELFSLLQVPYLEGHVIAPTDEARAIGKDGATPDWITMIAKFHSSSYFTQLEAQESRSATVAIC